MMFAALLLLSPLPLLKNVDLPVSNPTVPTAIVAQVPDTTSPALTPNSRASRRVAPTLERVQRVKAAPLPPGGSALAALVIRVQAEPQRPGQAQFSVLSRLSAAVQAKLTKERERTRVLARHQHFARSRTRHEPAVWLPGSLRPQLA